MENLGVNVKLLIAQLINFGLFFFIYKKFIAGPFVEVIKDEKKKDAERKKIAEEAEKQKATLQAAEKEAREQMRLKMEESLQSVRQSAEGERAQLIKKAQAEAEEIVKKASRQIGEERTEMEKEYKKTVAQVSVMAVENGLREFLTEDAQKQVNERILTHLNDKK